ncbi:MAG: LbtU family siderophore porin [Kiritimatiellaeota bacterium]|nr:LbtU family siderophore porin [Kiritimatiellota bacterium]
MDKVRALIAGVVLSGMTLSAVAQEEPVSKKEFEALQQQVTELKTLLNTQNEVRSERESGGLPDGLEFGALVEVEAGYSHSDPEDVSDIALATVELGAGWQFSDWIRGDLIFLYEEDDTPFDVDQAIVTLGNTEEFPLFLQVGKMYVPVGNLESFFISDPVVLELAEALETAVLIGFEKGGFSASLTAFNGDLPTDGEDQADNFVLAASYGVETEKGSLRFGASWIRNIMESDGLTGVLEDSFFAAPGDTASDDIGGFNAWVTAEMGPATLIAEYVTALDEFEVNGAAQGFTPSSLNLELGCAVNDRIDVAVKYEKSEDVSDWLAENRYGVVCSYLLSETELFSAGLALEYMKEDFGAGAEDADLFTMQLALEF